MVERGEPYADDPLTDPLAETIASQGAQGVEDRRLRENVRGALFGDAEPVRIGRYRLLDKLGEGGMGVVYRAHDDDLDRDVAIKLLRPGGSGTATRLLREARSMARLSHPHIAAVHDVGTHGDAVYIAMEFVDGASLRRWLGEPRTFLQIRDVMLQAARGLASAHDAGVVHRDFKPDNVIVGQDGRVRVVDFGLATLPHSSVGHSTDPVNTSAGRMMGTPRYMAPEQLRVRGAGPPADQFAFCVTLYEAAYGRLPFPGDVFAEVAAAVLGGSPDPPPSDTTVPPALWPLLQRGLATDPATRFDDMHATIVALEAIGDATTREAIASRPALRDAREHAREQLAGAFAESLLDADELDDRLERLEDARSPATVDALVADLAPPAPAHAVATNLPAIAEPPAISRITAILSGTKRAGHWAPARNNLVRSILGGIDLDFRDVELPPGVTELELQVFLGGVEIFVPTGVRVIVDANAVLGSIDQDDVSEPPPADAPCLRITGFVLLGSVDIHERLSGEGSIGAWWRRRATKKALRAAKRKALPPGR